MKPLKLENKRKYMEYKFIYTYDADTKSNLLSAGFIMISETANEAVFLNDKSKKISFDSHKVLYGNQLCI